MRAFSTTVYSEDARRRGASASAAVTDDAAQWWCTYTVNPVLTRSRVRLPRARAAAAYTEIRNDIPVAFRSYGQYRPDGSGDRSAWNSINATIYISHDHICSAARADINCWQRFVAEAWTDAGCRKLKRYFLSRVLFVSAFLYCFNPLRTNTVRVLFFKVKRG